MEPFDRKIWLSSPTMHGEELAFVKEAIETNWARRDYNNAIVMDDVIKQKRQMGSRRGDWIEM